MPPDDQEISRDDQEEVLDPENDDEPRRDGVLCPSDDDVPAAVLCCLDESCDDNDCDDGTGSDADDETTADSAAATGAGADTEALKAAAKVNKKQAKIDKANSEWIDIAQSETIDRTLDRPEPTLPEEGGPSEQCKRKPGDHLSMEV